MKRNLIKKTQNFAFENSLWSNGSKIIIGVSGGPDSVCLLNILAKLAPKCNFELHVAHVNYNLRGSDSLKDELFVRKLCLAYGIKLCVHTANKNQYKGNLENCLRTIRYEYFEKIRKELNYDLIAVAHNQDDQAETVLMRIIRGSGLNGLSAMKPKSGKIIRPLLQTSKSEILTFLKDNSLKFRKDKSNLDEKFTRNNIRHKLLPYLEKNFNPAIKNTLSQWSVSVADDYEFIEQNAERFTKNVCRNKCAHFNLNDFFGQHLAIQRQVLRNIFVLLKNDTKNIDNNQIEEILKVMRSTKSKTPKALIGGLKILKKGDNIEICC